MQAAAARPAGARALRRPDRLNATPHLRAGDDTGLLDALPIATAIFGLKDDKLWVHAMNAQFLELAGCGGDPKAFVEKFKQYSVGPGGRFTLAFLTDPAIAPTQLELVEGEGVGRRFLTMKLSPLPAGPNGDRRCLMSVVDRTVEVRAENALRAEMLRDSLTGLPNRLAFSEAIEMWAGTLEKISNMPCWSSTCCGSAASTNRWAVLPATSCSSRSPGD